MNDLCVDPVQGVVASPELADTARIGCKYQHCGEPRDARHPELAWPHARIAGLLLPDGSAGAINMCPSHAGPWFCALLRQCRAGLPQLGHGFACAWNGADCIPPVKK